MKWSPGCDCCGGGGNDCSFQNCECQNALGNKQVRPDVEITISGVTAPSSPYISCPGCTSFFNITITLACGETYGDPDAYFLCGPSSTVSSCGIAGADTYGIGAGIYAAYVAPLYIELILITTAGGVTQGATALRRHKWTWGFNDATCESVVYPGRACSVGSPSEVIASNAACSEVEDMLCGIENASISLAFV